MRGATVAAAVVAAGADAACGAAVAVAVGLAGAAVAVAVAAADSATGGGRPRAMRMSATRPIMQPSENEMMPTATGMGENHAIGSGRSEPDGEAAGGAGCVGAPVAGGCGVGAAACGESAAGACRAPGLGAPGLCAGARCGGGGPSSGGVSILTVPLCDPAAAMAPSTGREDGGGSVSMSPATFRRAVCPPTVRGGAMPFTERSLCPVRGAAFETGVPPILGPRMPAPPIGPPSSMNGSAGFAGVPAGAVVRTTGARLLDTGGPSPPRAVFSSSFVMGGSRATVRLPRFPGGIDRRTRGPDHLWLTYPDRRRDDPMWDIRLSPSCRSRSRAEPRAAPRCSIQRRRGLGGAHADPPRETSDRTSMSRPSFSATSSIALRTFAMPVACGTSMRASSRNSGEPVTGAS